MFIYSPILYILLLLYIIVHVIYNHKNTIFTLLKYVIMYSICQDTLLYLIFLSQITVCNEQYFLFYYIYYNYFLNM